MRIGIKKIKTGELFVDSKVQRSITKSSVNKKVKEFDSNALGILIVSKRANGLYHILDGQHRFLAAVECGIEELECEVHVNLTEKEEAELFLKYNQERVSTKPIDHFNIEVKAGKTDSVIINSILNEFNLNVSRRSVQAPKALKQVYNNYGEDNFRKTLRLINEVWGVEAMKAPVIGGISTFIDLGGEKLNIDKLIITLKHSPNRIFDEVVIRAQRIKVAQRYTSTESYCQVMIAIHNKQYKNKEMWIVRNPLDSEIR